MFQRGRESCVNDVTLLSGKGMWNVCKRIFPFRGGMLLVTHLIKLRQPFYLIGLASSTTIHQVELFINKTSTCRGKQLSFPHCETFKHQRTLLYNIRESTAKNMERGQRYEILKIWVPTHGVVNVYRSPGGGTETVLEA